MPSTRRGTPSASISPGKSAKGRSSNTSSPSLKLSTRANGNKYENKESEARAMTGPSAQGEKEGSSLREFVETNGHFSLVRNFHLADVFTLLNGFCGTSSILTSCRYLLYEASLSGSTAISTGAVAVERKLLYTALAWPLAGLFFDFMDGKVARWRKSSSMLGQELDSLADLVSFGIAPAVLAFAVGLRHPLDTLALTLFVCAGIARLARFNATVASVPKDAKGKAKYFEGLPIPSSLILVGVMAFLVKQGRIGISGAPGSWFDIPETQIWRSLLTIRPLEEVFGQSANYIGDLKGLPYGTLPVPSFLGGQVHVFAFVWVIWASMMVSKTLKIPKI